MIKPNAAIFMSAAFFLFGTSASLAEDVQRTADSQDSTSASQAGTVAPMSGVKLEDLSFLTGKWRVSKDGETTEEIWGSVQGDSIVGHCHSVQNSKSTLYELIAVLKVGNELVMRIKHFKNGFVPWDEKAEPGDLHLIKFATNEATFQNRSKDTVSIQYKRTDKQLTAVVTVLRDGQPKRFSSEYQLVE